MELIGILAPMIYSSTSWVLNGGGVSFPRTNHFENTWYNHNLIATEIDECKDVTSLIRKPPYICLIGQVRISTKINPLNIVFFILWLCSIGHECLEKTYSISQEICTRFLLCCALLWLYIDWFSHIHQAYFTGTVAIWRLPQCQQSNPDEYG